MLAWFRRGAKKARKPGKRKVAKPAAHKTTSPHPRGQVTKRRHTASPKPAAHAA